MEKRLEKPASSFGFWIFIVVCAYLGYALYFAIYGLNFGISLTSDSYVYNLVSKNPWWWAVLYYGSEGFSGSVALILRVIGGFFAVYSAFLFWRKKDAALPKIKGKVGAALLFEAGAFLFLIPSVIAAFAYYSSTEYLYYFDHTPGLLLLYGTGIPCLAMVLVIPPLLLKLRAKITRGASSQEIVKWSCLTGVGYLFVVFWFNYSMLWAAAMVPYPRLQQQYGLSFLFEPANFASFAVTVFGLFAIAVLALVLTLPAIRKQQPLKLNRRGLGAVTLAFGGYFVFNTLVYSLTGGYEAHPSVWYEVIGPLHNPYLWCAAFIFLGSAVLVRSKNKELDQA
ncbi:MAG: hypothetical protein NWE99_06735 [Candidatus Bathyarchaeota archaeon]|nr:hypothetical protein [Candidatus Bathyarchaeota archaeon]